MVSGARARVRVGPPLGLCLAPCLNLRPSGSLFSVSLRSVSPIPSFSHPLVSLFLELCLSFYIPLYLSLLFSPSFCLPGPFSFPLSLRLSLPPSPLFFLFPPLAFFALSFSLSLHLSIPFSESVPLHPDLFLVFCLFPFPRPLPVSLHLCGSTPRVPPPPPAVRTPRPAGLLQSPGALITLPLPRLQLLPPPS